MIAFKVLDYPLSYVELIGTLFGLISVYYASRANILTWPTGIINEIALFVLFYQTQLYADMFLQVYFFVVTIFGWYKWKSNTADVPVTSAGSLTWIVVTMIVGTIAAGAVITNIHIWLPQWFRLPAAYPFADSFVMVGSILATILLARKQVENWYLWIIVDVVSIVVYLLKGIYFLSLEYVIFLGLASFGLYRWKKQLRHV
jgi:nicotinamide mononucleotide transporter